MASAANGSHKMSIYIDLDTHLALQYLKSEGINLSGTLQKMVKDKAAALKAFNLMVAAGEVK